MSDLPRVVLEGELDICGLKLRTYVLANGRRIINASDVAVLLDAWGQGVTMTAEEAKKLASWCHDRAIRS